LWLELSLGYGTEVPDLSGLGKGDGDEENQAVILLTGDAGDARDALGQVLEGAWFRVETANDPEAAEAILREQENAVLVVVDLNPGYSDEQVCGRIAEFRQHMAWSRLPALIRVPHDCPQYEKVLREAGATSRFVSLEEKAEKTAVLIQDAINMKKDFKWGISVDP
jgi:DNA-binding NtrC family response regulator